MNMLVILDTEPSLVILLLGMGSLPNTSGQE